MKVTTMTLTGKRRTVLPLDWCRREGLEQGGPLNAFDLGEAGLLVRPVKAPSPAQIEKLLAQTPVDRKTSKQAAAIVERALRKMRR